MATKKAAAGSAATAATVTLVREADPAKNRFDGKKADVFINTGKLGKVFLIKVPGAAGKPTLIAVHL